MKRNIWYFQTRLILIQIFLVLPMLALVSFALFFWAKTSVIETINESRNDSLQTAAGAYDQIYLRMTKLLEKPYTDTGLYSIITSTDSNNTSVTTNNSQTNKLLNNILYYEPDIVAITMALESTDSAYYKRRAPTVSINVHNSDWYNLTESDWYQDAMATDQYITAPAVIDELYLHSGVTIPIYQRLLDVRDDRKIGVFRLDLGIQNFYSSWNQIVQKPARDILLVTDSYNQLVFCSSSNFLKKYPLLTDLTLEMLPQKYHQNIQTAPQSQLKFIYLSEGISTLDLTQPLFWIGIGLILFYVLYAITFIRWSSQYISRPIQKLKTAMIQGQENKLWVRCEPLAGEIGELGDAFNELMEQMELLITGATKHEQEKARLAYEILQSKINPHFLYNTLNAIRYKSDMIGAQDISHTLESLASLLRFTIKCTDEVIPFETELTQLEHYIQIMRIRYGDEIEIDFDIDDQCYSYKCLKFLVQPIVENCYMHAFRSENIKKSMVLIKIICEESGILVSVTDNGDGMTQAQIEKITTLHSAAGKSNYFDIGIDNVKQRIETLFGSPYTLKIESEHGCFTKVTAHIPLISTEPEDT